MIAGTLEVQLLADMARLKADMDRGVSIVSAGARAMERAADVAKAALAGMAAGVTAAAFASMIRGALDSADSLNKLSQRTGIAVESLSQLQYAAKLSDVSNESLTGGIRKLNVAIAEGLAGDKEKLSSFRALGITTADLGKGTQAVMMKMADAYKQAEDGAGKTQNAVKLLGKAGDEMIPLLNGGSQALRDMMQEADKLGLTIGTNFAKQAEEFNDNLTRLRTGGQALGIALGSELVKSLGDVVKAMADAKVASDNTNASLAAVFGEGLRTAVQAVVILFANFWYVIKQTGIEIGGMAAQLAALARGDFSGFKAIGEAMKADAQGARAEVEKFEKTVMGLGEKASATAGDFARMDRAAQGVKGTIKSTSAEAVNEYDALIKRIKERIDLSHTELAAGRELTDMEKFAAKVVSDLAQSKKALTAQQVANATAMLEAAKAADLLVQIQKSELALAKERAGLRQNARNTDYEQAAQGLREITDEYAKNLAAVKDRVRSLKDESEAMDLARLLNITLAEAIEAVAIARLEERREKLLEGSEGYLAVTREIEERKKLLGMMSDKAVIDNAQKAREEWDRTNKAIGDGFVDALMGGGKSVAQYLKQLFRTLVLNPILQPIGNMVASAITSVAGPLVSGVTSALGLGSIATAGTTLATTFTTALSAIPVWGWIIGGAAILAGIFGSSGGGPKTEGGYAPAGIDIRGRDIGGNLQGSVRGDIGGAKAISDSISSAYANVAKTLGIKNGKLEVGVFFAMDNAKGGTSLTQLQIATGSYNRSDRTGGIENVARGEEALKKEVTDETARVILAALKESDLGEKFKTYLNGIDIGADAATINAGIQTVQIVQQLDKALGALGPGFDNVTGLSVEMTTALIDAAGGFDKFTSDLKSFYDNFYTDAERTAAATKQIDDVFASLGMSTPKTREEFRKLVESQDLTTESGRKTYAALMGVNGAFAELHPLVVEVADAVEETADTVTVAVEQMAQAGEILANQGDLAIEAARLAFEQAEAWYDKQAAVLRGQMDVLEETIRSHKGYSDALKALRKELTTGALAANSPEEQYRKTKAEFDRLAALAVDDPERLAGLSDAGRAFLEASKAYNATSEAYFMDLAKVLGTAEASQVAVDATLVLAQAQYDVLKEQLEHLRSSEEYLRLLAGGTPGAPPTPRFPVMPGDAPILYGQPGAPTPVEDPGWRVVNDTLQRTNELLATAAETSAQQTQQLIENTAPLTSIDLIRNLEPTPS